MNYEDRAKLQSKIQHFTTDELKELKDYIIQKEISERNAKIENLYLQSNYI